jgi:hypothetical protein
LADSEAGGSVSQLVLDLAALGLDAVELAAEFVFGPARLAHEVEVLTFFGVRRSEPCGQLSLQGGEAAEFVHHGLVNERSHLGAELLA